MQSELHVIWQENSGCTLCKLDSPQVLIECLESSSLQCGDAIVQRQGKKAHLSPED